jgi:hypothetical protein
MSAERGCQVVINAKAKAQSRGFNPELVFCPLLTGNACDGQTCMFNELKDVVKVSSQVEKFFNKLETRNGKGVRK